MSRFAYLRSASVDVAVDLSGGLPAIVHWGVPLGASPDVPVLEKMAEDFSVPGSLDVSRRVEIVPMHGDGFPGRPGLQGHRRGGRHWAPRFRVVEVSTEADESSSVLLARSHDPVAEIALVTRMSLSAHGVLVIGVELENLGDSPYMLDALSVSIPLPGHAAELGVYSGRWAREFQLERFAWIHGAWTAENRSGRTSHEHPPFTWVFEEGATESRGEVWGLHLAWSGNHATFAERLSDGRRYVQLGELFHPGEVCVDPGERYSTPDIVCVHSAQGITGASQSYHRHVRRVSPRRAAPRPVHLNTWEAVYFDHDVERLKTLATAAAEVGVERFVLDDGWFGGRRDDSRGLGDWVVSPEMYPHGLGPLIDHVREAGMEFGIWVEPEMANPDSTLLREHPDWVLATSGYEPVLGRNQVVVDFTRDEVVEHIHGRLDDLLRNHAISYVKWDMNRPLVQASTADGKAAGRQQVVAVYRLLDRLRASHPEVEFESCASGGGRIDFEILKRVERVWTSDSNDALERQAIMRGASMVLPLEVLGSHVGPSPSHTTRRRHSMAFRGATALFGHFGIEADIASFDERERADMRRIIDVYKRFRPLLHSGDFFRIDPATASRSSGQATALVHGVVSDDASQALICMSQLATEDSLIPDRVRLHGLNSDAQYRVEFVPLSESQVSGGRLGPALVQPDWLRCSVEGQPTALSGAMLMAVGLARPVLWPESAIVVHLSCA